MHEQHKISSLRTTEMFYSEDSKCKLYSPLRDAAASAKVASSQSLQEKSVCMYKQYYKRFIVWCEKQKVNKYSEYVLLAYFNQKSKQFNPGSLWSEAFHAKTYLAC